MQSLATKSFKASVIVPKSAMKFFSLRRNMLYYILKAIKNATGTSVIFPINISFIHFVFVRKSVPNVGERFTKT